MCIVYTYSLIINGLLLPGDLLQSISRPRAEYASNLVSMIVNDLLQSLGRGVAQICAFFELSESVHKNTETDLNAYLIKIPEIAGVKIKIKKFILR